MFNKTAPLFVARVARLFILIGGLSMLTACGGGGSDTPPPPFVVTVTSNPTQLDENTSGTVGLSITGAQNTVASTLTVVSGDAGAVTITPSGNGFTLTANEVDRDKTVSLNLRVTDGSNTQRQFSTTLTVQIVNTSFAGELSNITLVNAQQTRLVGLTEEKQLLVALRDVATILGTNVTPTVSTGVSDETAALELAFTSLNDGIADYRVGKIADTALVQLYTGLIAQLTEHSAATKTEINQLLAVLSADGKTPVTLTDFTVSPELNTVSLVVGNPALGRIENGQWVYADNVRYLDGLLNNTGCAL